MRVPPTEGTKSTGLGRANGGIKAGVGDQRGDWRWQRVAEGQGSPLPGGHTSLGEEQAGGLRKQETRSPPQVKMSGGEKFLAHLAKD